jgi:hypothetical protein
MSRIISYKDAINEALSQEMERDKSVIVMGLDNAGGRGTEGEKDAWGGVLGVTKGLYAKFGDRVMDTPISESSYIGSAVGAAACGMRPVVEMMFVDFLGVCFDQMMNQAAKFRYMFGGKAVTPVVMRTMYGGGFRAAAQHSQVLYNILAHIPGLKVVVPSTPYDAKGLLIECIRDNDPVIFLEHKALYGMKGEVPEESYTIPFGQANIVREGERPDHRGPWANGAHGDPGSSKSGQDRCRCGGHRSADHITDRLGNNTAERGEDRQAGGGRRSEPALQYGDRHLGKGCAGCIQGADSTDQDGDGTAYAAAVL